MSNETPTPEARIEYFKDHAMPYLLEHLRLRSIGLQIFTAIQGGLLVAWATHTHWALAILGLASCLSFALWDARDRRVFKELNQLGEEIVDRSIFGTGADGRATRGVHKFLVDAMAQSGRGLPRLGDNGGLASHTWAIRIMLLSSTIVWIVLIVSAILIRSSVS